MKYLKTYKLFYELENRIKDLLSQERYQPNITIPDIPGDLPDGIRSGLESGENEYFYKYHKDTNYPLQLDANESKYGKVYAIKLLTSFAINSRYVNDEIKSSNFIQDVKDILMDFDDSAEPVLNKFKFFGHEIIGEKYGKDKGVEDITPKVDKLLNELKNEDIYSRNLTDIFIHFVLYK